jgi:hypothetical protein
MTSPHTLSLTVAFLLGLVACQSEPAETDEGAADTTAAAAPPVVEVTAVDYAFQMPAELASGWTTLRFANHGAEEHFMSLWKLPEGRTLEDYLSGVAVAFGQAYAVLVEGGSRDSANAVLGAALPEWYGAVVPMGGPGFLSPGRVGETTLRLDPGTYVVECYVKTADGRFHGELGMIQQLTVTADSTGAAAPTADVDVVLWNDRMEAPGALAAGAHTVGVRFAEQPEIGLGNDVHLVRLPDGTDVQAVARWMDWMNLDGLMAPAPAEFLGGAQERPAGEGSAFRVEVEPGRYAWIGEPSGRTAELVVE